MIALSADQMSIKSVEVSLLSFQPISSSFDDRVSTFVSIFTRLDTDL